MFHLDRVNRLPEQTQRRMYGCALLVLRRVGVKKKFFAGRVSPNKASETRPTRLNIRPTCSNHDTYISVPPPPTQYRRAILYDTYTIYNSRLQKARDESLYPPTFQKSLIHPPFKASHPPTFIIQQPRPAARGILSSFVLQRT